MPHDLYSMGCFWFCFCCRWQCFYRTSNCLLIDFPIKSSEANFQCFFPLFIDRILFHCNFASQFIGRWRWPLLCMLFYSNESNLINSYQSNCILCIEPIKSIVIVCITWTVVVSIFKNMPNAVCVCVCLFFPFLFLPLKISADWLLFCCQAIPLYLTTPFVHKPFRTAMETYSGMCSTLTHTTNHRV